jgi:hypothetical protein
MDAKKTPYGILVGKREGKRSLGRPRYGWVNNVKIKRRELG